LIQLFNLLESTVAADQACVNRWWYGTSLKS